MEMNGADSKGLDGNGFSAYPIDFRALNKGDYLSPEFVAERMGTAVGTQRHQFAVLNLKSEIEKRTPYTAKCEGQGIRILTDEEAAVYNPSRFESHLVAAARRQERNLAVDITQLPDHLRQAHERNLLHQGAILAAVVNTRRQYRLSKSQKEESKAPELAGRTYYEEKTNGTKT